MSKTLCDGCEKRWAAVVVTRIENGIMTSRNLCQKCADAEGEGGRCYREPISPKVVPLSLFSEERASSSATPSEISIPDFIKVNDLADAMNVKLFRVLGVLISLKVFVTKESMLDFATAVTVGQRLGVKVKKLPG
ncbi:MAG: hypothetical protein JWO08_3751 [Verrucomicrobiaceae bacterium]|nr:hypothetical protein [Verrucomicrobiaceae bacterium]